MDELDDRFHEGIIQTKALMNVYLHKNYPPELLVDEDLVDTILKHIPDDQQDNLENNIQDDGMVLNRFQQKRGFNQRNFRNRQMDGNSRKKVLICSICGGTGHDGLKDGCDLMCKSVNINNFLSSNKKATPKVLKDLMDKFKGRNKERIQRAKQRLQISKLGLTNEVEETILQAMVTSSDDKSNHSDNNSTTSE